MTGAMRTAARRGRSGPMCTATAIGQVWLYQYGGSKAVCMRSIELPGQQFTLRYDYTILPRIVRDVSGAFGLPPEITTAIVNLLIKAGAS